MNAIQKTTLSQLIRTGELAKANQLSQLMAMNGVYNAKRVHHEVYEMFFATQRHDAQSYDYHYSQVKQLL